MTIKLEVGRRYVDALGNTEAITDQDSDGFFVSSIGNRYTEDGRFLGVIVAPRNSPPNLIALAPDEGQVIHETEAERIARHADEADEDAFAEIAERELMERVPDEGAPEPDELATLRAENARLREALLLAREWLNGWASAKWELARIDAALAQKGERG